MGNAIGGLLGTFSRFMVDISFFYFQVPALWGFFSIHMFNMPGDKVGVTFSVDCFSYNKIFYS